MFTQSCFIRKNSLELRKKLEYLGHIYDEDEVFENAPITACKEIFIWNAAEDAVLIGFIDCGTNEELFLALAALRNDTDAYQWFVNEIGNVWWRTEFDSFLECFIESNEDSELKYEDFHKATPEELIKHFNHE